jgi:hypothetical protein
VLAFLWMGLQSSEQEYLSWTEPSGLLMLFRGRPDRIPSNAFKVVDAAWTKIGVS